MRICLLLLSLLLVAAGFESSQAARSSGFSSGRSSRGWSNSPARPATPPSTVRPAPQPAPPRPETPGRPATPPPNAGWSNSGGASGSGAKSPGGASSFATSGRSGLAKESSFKAYQAYTGKFGKNGNPVPPTTPPPNGRTWNSYGDYRSHRDGWYAGRGWSPPPYAWRSYPSFGLWDAMFLWFMLRQVSGPGFFYNHQHDPGVQSFLGEAQGLAATDPELAGQLAQVKERVNELKTQGAPVDPQALPKDVDPSVAYAAEATVHEEPEGGSWLPTAVALGGGLLLVYWGSRIFLRRRAHPA